MPLHRNNSRLLLSYLTNQSMETGYDHDGSSGGGSGGGSPDDLDQRF